MIRAEELTVISSYQTLSAEKKYKSYEVITKPIKKAGAYNTVQVKTSYELYCRVGRGKHLPDRLCCSQGTYSAKFKSKKNSQGSCSMETMGNQH